MPRPGARPMTSHMDAQMTSLPPMTIIVAATLKNGIGQAGGLPWRLPKEMKYFARVTTGEPIASACPDLPTSSRPRNTVIMGRKTWDGIPAKYRPLPGRRNIIITRNVEGVDALSTAENTTAHTSVRDALRSVASVDGRDGDETDRIFLIGGSQLYTQALEEIPNLSEPQPDTSTANPSQPHVDRILLTRILTPFAQCDTFVHLLPSEENPRGWKLASHEELVKWVGGWEVPRGIVEEKGVEYRFEMWTR